MSKLSAFLSKLTAKADLKAWQESSATFYTNLKSAKFRSKFGLPIVSLIVAIILWNYAVGEQSVEVTLKVPLSVTPPAGRMTVLNSSLQDITLKLSVPRNLMSVVSHGSVRAFHHVSGVEKPGEYNFRIQRSDILLPPGNIRLLSIRPEVLTVTLDELIIQKLPIKVNLEGEPAVDYFVDMEKIRLDPNAVLVEGPQSKLGKINEIMTESVNLIGRTRAFRKKVRLELDPDLKPITKNQIVDVFVPVRREYASSAFRDVAVNILGTPESVDAFSSIKPERINFSIKGPRSILDKIAPQSVIPYVDVSGLEKGEYELSVEFKLPDEISLDGKLDKLKVKIK